ncbi:hypothetical protein [Roseovarius nanhaiticus]|uniref:hypothetical protein n=1 Tax=Roseovarius nanhaiticus TaxID=573024 RepID=UPI00248FBDC8|nr:hypothetical protein [Roseovarius nanhaiticus]
MIVHSAPLFPPLLAPFHLGPGAALRPAYELREALTSDVAWFGLVLALFCASGLTALAVVRRRDRVYHWAALAAAASAVLSIH